MGNLPGPTFVNLEYFFFLVYRLFQGIGTFFRSLFQGFSGSNSSRLKDFYQGNSIGSNNCNPFLGDICSGSVSERGFLDNLFGSGTFESVTALGVGLRIFLIIIILFLLFVMIYSIFEWYKIKNQSDKHIENLIPQEDPRENQNKRWLRVKELIASNNDSDWKIAIFEADSMLEDMTLAMNIPGDTLGERLKSVEPSDFLTLQKAWEAHKIRNQIAHQGSTYALDHRTALLAIKMFEEVFQEFRLI